jgi:hypothetical protein
MYERDIDNKINFPKIESIFRDRLLLNVLPINLKMNNRRSRTDPYSRDIEYYETIDKVFWVPVSDIQLESGEIIKGNTPTSCIFVERNEDEEEENKGMSILQFDMSIEFDQWRYTAWRKVLGVMHGIRVDVLLISSHRLFTLDGVEVDFDSLGRSDIWIDKNLLGKIDIKK